MSLHTILPFIVCICFIKNVICLKADLSAIKRKVHPYIYPVAILIVLFCSTVLRYEGALFANDVASWVMVSVVVIILFWSTLNVLLHFQFHLYIWIVAILFGSFS